MNRKPNTPKMQEENRVDAKRGRKPARMQPPANLESMREQVEAIRGTGGLVKAYGDSTKLVLDGIETEELVEKASFSLTIGYEMYENTKRILAAASADSLKEDFGTEITITGQIPASEKDNLSSRISDLSNGKRQVIF